MLRIVPALLLIVFLSRGMSAQGQSFSLGPVQTVPNPEPALPTYRFCPDGHISLLKDGDDLQMIWAGGTSYRTRGRSIFQMRGPEAVLKPGPAGSYDNGGAWLFAVFRQDANSLIGFYHAEDHEFIANPASKFIAWKSAALCKSDDDGKTWRKHGRIITSAVEKPAQPTWGGCGDFCVVWDGANSRWACFYQEHFLCLAVSADRDGKPGSWKKLYDGDFMEPGLGGRNSSLAGLEGHAGGNPSVHFNSFLDKWVMVWGTWDRGSPSPNSIWLSTSDNLVNWSPPRLVVEASGRTRFWYPTILGGSDVEAGEKALLCYAYFPDKNRSEREFRAQEIVFKKAE